MYSFRETVISERPDGQRELQVVQYVTADEAREAFGTRDIYDENGEIVASLDEIKDDGKPDEQSATAPNDAALTGAVAAMAMAMANLMEPTEAAALNEAAAVLMEGGNDGDA